LIIGRMKFVAVQKYTVHIWRFKAHPFFTHFAARASARKVTGIGLGRQNQRNIRHVLNRPLSAL
jgi:hypothetical protein